MQAPHQNSQRTSSPAGAGEVVALSAADVAQRLAQLSGWRLAGAEIVKTYDFADHYQVMAFANAVAWISHGQDHHPEMEIGFRRCRIRYATHSVGGLSDKDFTCAALVDALLPSWQLHGTDCSDG